MSQEDLLYQRPDNVESPTNFFIEYIGTLTNDVWPIAITFISFSIVYLSLNDYNPRKAFGAASFTQFIVVTLLVGLGAFESQALIVSIILVILGVVVNGGRN